MGREFTLAQRIENARFVEILGETGNARLAAREIGRKPSTMHHRRGVDAAFAQNWEAAVAAAHARFHLGGGRRGPEAGEAGSESAGAPLDPSAALGTGFARDERGGGKRKKVLRQAQDERVVEAQDERMVGAQDERVVEAQDERVVGARRERGGGGGAPLRTKGGETVVVRSQNGKLQLRFAHPDKLTKKAEQVFLASLSATANVRLSAAAAGASAAAFYRRRRQNKAFAREWRLALKMGYERLECAMLSAAAPESMEHNQWRRGNPPPIPPLSFEQALQALAHHWKPVHYGWDRPHMKKRRGEPWETYTVRLRAMWAHKEAIEAEERALARAAARAASWEERGSWRLADEPEPLPLPPLHLVTGWSKANKRPPWHAGVAMFGGWRIADMQARMR